MGEGGVDGLDPHKFDNDEGHDFLMFYLIFTAGSVADADGNPHHRPTSPDRTKPVVMTFFKGFGHVQDTC
jgi:hypothetical protein